jgi:hypothetical protein
MIYYQLWGYKVEDKLHLGLRVKKMLNTTAVEEPNALVDLNQASVCVCGHFALTCVMLYIVHVHLLMYCV